MKMNKVVYRIGSCDIMLPKNVIEWLIGKNFPLHNYTFNTQENGSNYNIYDVPRHHPLPLQCVEKFHDILYKHPYNLRVETIKGNKYYVDKEENGEKVITPNDIEWVTIGKEETVISKEELIDFLINNLKVEIKHPTIHDDLFTALNTNEVQITVMLAGRIICRDSTELHQLCQPHELKFNVEDSIAKKE